MYKHANDEVPLKVSCKKYLAKSILKILSLSCIFKILFKSILHNTGKMRKSAYRIKIATNGYVHRLYVQGSLTTKDYFAALCVCLQYAVQVMSSSVKLFSEVCEFVNKVVKWHFKHFTLFN